jgi:hypothetical protein
MELKTVRECKACGFKEQYEGACFGAGFVTKEFLELFTEHKILINNPKECAFGDYDYQQKVPVRLYACPECGTVFMEVE